MWIALCNAAPALCLLDRSRLATGAAAAVLAAISTFGLTVLCSLYAGDMVANLWWGSNLDVHLVAQYVFQPGGLWRDAATLPASAWAVLLAVPALWFAIMLRLAGPLLDEMQQWRQFLELDGLSLWDLGRRGILVVGVPFAVAAASVWLAARHQPLVANLLWCDPLLAFVCTEGDARLADESVDPGYASLVARLKLDEPRERGAYPHLQTFVHKNVILIIVDSLRADHMQLYGYARPTTPFLCSLAGRGLLHQVDFGTSTCAESNCGIVSTLASKTRREMLANSFKLPDLLSDLGYRTYYILSGNHDWLGLKKYYGTDMTLYFDGTSSKQWGWNDDHVVIEGVRRLPAYDGTPAFLYLHLMSVHFMGDRFAEFERWKPCRLDQDWNALFSGRYDHVRVLNHYDDGVLQADALIRRLFDALGHKGYLDNSVVVIEADHGEGLGDRGPLCYGHITMLYREYSNIPILFYDPDATFHWPAIHYGTQIDVAPTLLDRLGLTIPASWRGVSLLRPQSSRMTFHQTRLQDPTYAVMDVQGSTIYQYISHPRSRREELYDVTHDPQEETDLMQAAPRELVRRLRDEVAKELCAP